jgi:hypothetical protein
MPDGLASIHGKDLNYADFKLRNAQNSKQVAFEVSDPAHPYVQSILDRFVNLLAEANWQRHIALRNIHRTATHDVNPAEVLLDIQALTKSIFVPVPMFHDSGLGSSLPAQSNCAISVASHLSFVSSVADKTNGGLRIPSTPKEVFERVPFACQVCGRVLVGLITESIGSKLVMLFPICRLQNRGSKDCVLTD